MKIQRTDVYQKGTLLSAPLNLKKEEPAWEILSQQLKKACLSRLRRLENTNFTVISNDCCASFLYDSLNLQKATPTCGMTIGRYAFVDFCLHLRAYLSMPVEEPTEEDLKRYPGCKAPIGILRGTGELPSIGLIFTHYPSLETAREAWYRRRERVNYDNLFFILDCCMETSEALQDAFERLPYENKVMFTRLEDPERWKDTFCFSCFTDGSCHAAYFMDYLVTDNGIFRVLDEFDYVNWLNQGQPSGGIAHTSR